MSCVICSEEFEGVKNKIYLNCGHDFHCHCFFTLLSYNDKKCPLCREEINYQVPVTDLQARLTTLEGTHNQLTADYGILAAEYRLINDSLTRTRAVQLLTSTQNELELQLKIRENMRLKQEKDRLIQENNKIKRDRVKLRGQLRDSERRNNVRGNNNLELIRIKN